MDREAHAEQEDTHARGVLLSRRRGAADPETGTHLQTERPTTECEQSALETHSEAEDALMTALVLDF